MLYVLDRYVRIKVVDNSYASWVNQFSCANVVTVLYKANWIGTFNDPTKIIIHNTRSYFIENKTLTQFTLSHIC